MFLKSVIDRNCFRMQMWVNIETGKTPELPVNFHQITWQGGRRCFRQGKFCKSDKLIAWRSTNCTEKIHLQLSWMRFQRIQKKFTKCLIYSVCIWVASRLMDYLQRNCSAKISFLKSMYNFFREDLNLLNSGCIKPILQKWCLKINTLSPLFQKTTIDDCWSNPYYLA